MARSSSAYPQAVSLPVDRRQALEHRALGVSHCERLADCGYLFWRWRRTPFVLSLANDRRRDAGPTRQFALAHAASGAQAVHRLAEPRSGVADLGVR